MKSPVIKSPAVSHGGKAFRPKAVHVTNPTAPKGAKFPGAFTRRPLPASPFVIPRHQTTGLPHLAHTGAPTVPKKIGGPVKQMSGARLKGVQIRKGATTLGQMYRK